jgi:uncharacterized phage protein gp47/JayE
VLQRKRQPIRGGTAEDWKVWAEEVTGVSAAIVQPKVRGNGTIDIIIFGTGGSIPVTQLVSDTQTHIDGVTPADLAGGAVVVYAPTAMAVDLTITNSVLRNGYTLATARPILTTVFNNYLNSANISRNFTVIDLLVALRTACDPSDVTQTPILLNFNRTAPTADIQLTGKQGLIAGTISIS